jgi:hypothetical protein
MDDHSLMLPRLPSLALLGASLGKGSRWPWTRGFRDIFGHGRALYHGSSVSRYLSEGGGCGGINW